MRSSKYNRELLAPIVATSRSYAEVLRRLGLKTTGGNHRNIASRIRRAELDVGHFTYGKGIERSAPVPLENLEDLVRSSTSVAQVAAKLGKPTHGRPHRQLTLRIEELDLDTSHFRGRGWSRGETMATHPSLANASQRRRLPDSEVFVENGPLLGGPRIAQRLLALGWQYRCAWCGIVDWRGTRLVLHVDHINGINNDNRFENLRLLCPNCHSQTDTYCNRAREEAACYMFEPTRACWNW